MSFVMISDVGPRDGLQNESVAFSAHEKAGLIDLLYASGLQQVEIGSYVSPTKVPSMANTEEVASRLSPLRRRQSMVVVPNAKGLERAQQFPVGTIAILVSASETFSQRNTNRSIQNSFDVASELMRAAKKEGVHVRGYVSCVWGCPYEGAVGYERVEQCVSFFQAHDVTSVALSDTIGIATPADIKRMLRRMRPYLPHKRTVLHLHDTYGQALANILAALEEGIQAFDASIGGLGGCPYAPGATGNVATEDVVYMLHGLGCSTGIDMAELLKASVYVRDVLRVPLKSKVSQAQLARVA